ncbi:type VI secretion system baseplate subunit TssF [Ottowia sp. VDI28]|uniref:type VI secretion system baseplate subunit TssF n=1 Tax=Ottowia sp. VDI28 TaxID=3133968 RepID=UPI003C30770F
MDPRLLDLYEKELRYFRESAGEFARAYPKIARRLAIEETEIADPYVERLIEATAFLSSRVALKLDAEYPRFTGHLLDIVYPHFLAPTPSMIVARLEVDLGDTNLARGATLPRGSGLRSQHASSQGTHCDFRTAHALKVWPIEVVSARYFSYAPDLPLTKHPQGQDIRGGLRIRLRTAGELLFSQLPIEELSFHLGGGEDVAWRLYECAQADPVGVMVRAISDSPASDVIHHLPEDAIETAGFREDEALLPQTATGFSGYRLMQEYFAFPQRFQFVRLTGLASALAGMHCQEIELVWLFSRGDAALEPLVDSSHAQLHCVAAINLFPKRLDRVSMSEGVNQFHLLVDRTRPLDFEVHSITEVVGHGVASDGDDAREQLFLPFYAAFHGSRHAHPAYYTTTREPRVLSTRQRQEGHRSSHIGSEVFMQIVDPQQAPYSSRLRQLAVAALCTNRDLPLMMPLGTGNDLYCVDAFPVQRVSVVRGPSPPHSPVVSQGLGWKALDHLALNYLSVSDSDARQGAAALREMLALYAGRGEQSRQVLVQALQSVACKAVSRRLPMAGPIAFGRGLEVALQVDPAAFAGQSALLFGAVMSHFLQRHVEINHFVETVLRNTRGDELMRWRPLCGSRPIL